MKTFLFFSKTDEKFLKDFWNFFLKIKQKDPWTAEEEKKETGEKEGGEEGRDKGSPWGKDKIHRRHDAISYISTSINARAKQDIKRECRR